MDEILVMSESVIDNNGYFYGTAEGAEPIDTAYLAELLFREYEFCDHQ